MFCEVAHEFIGAKQRDRVAYVTHQCPAQKRQAVGIALDNAGPGVGIVIVKKREIGNEKKYRRGTETRG